MRTRHVLSLVSLLALAACGGDDGPTGSTSLSGSLSFAYTGAGGGNFSVSGAAPALSANIGAASWAAGTRDDAANEVSVAGVRARGSNRYDLMVLGIRRVTVGSVTVDANCDPDSGQSCSGFAFVLNASEADQNFDFVCVATTGSLAISSISSTRAEGTFTGSGSCFSAAGTQSNFTVTNGTFNVALLSEAQFPQ